MTILLEIKIPKTPVMKLPQSIKEKLSQEYHNSASPSSYSTPYKLWKVVKKSEPTLTLAQVKYWFSTQDIPSRFQQAKKKFPRTITVTRAPNIQWLSDLCDFKNLTKFNKNHRYLMVVQDCFSRFLIGLVSLKRKLSKDVAAALDNLIKQTELKCEIFFTDSGLEYSGECKNVYKKYGIEHVTTKDFVQKASITERANLVIKQRLYKMMAADNTFFWIDKLNDVKNAYNNTYNRNLGMTPTEALQWENKSKVFYNTVTRRENEALAKKNKEGFKNTTLINVFVFYYNNHLGKVMLEITLK